ncbi:MAG: tetratricopeptide repeat protein [bacterium]
MARKNKREKINTTIKSRKRLSKKTKVRIGIIVGIIGFIGSVLGIWQFFVSKQPATKKDLAAFATKADIEELKQFIEQKRGSDSVELDGLPDKGPELRALVKNALQAEIKLKYKSAITLWQEIIDSRDIDDLGKCSAYLQIASLYINLFDYSNASKTAEKAENIAVKINNNIMLAEADNLLGVVHQLIGDYSTAETLYLRALKIRENIFSKEHPIIATSLNNLALLYYYQKKYSQAEPLFQRALKLKENAFGLDSLPVADSLNNLASLYQDQEKYTLAESFFQHALKIREKSLGPECIEVANILQNLALLYQDQKKYALALSFYQRALKIKEKILGSDHPNVAELLNNFALFYQDQGKYTQAEPLYYRALVIEEKVLGRNHPKEAPILENMARLYKALGQNEKAKELANRAKQIRSQQKY